MTAALLAAVALSACSLAPASSPSPSILARVDWQQVVKESKRVTEAAVQAEANALAELFRLEDCGRGYDPVEAAQRFIARFVTEYSGALPQQPAVTDKLMPNDLAAEAVGQAIAGATETMVNRAPELAMAILEAYVCKLDAEAERKLKDVLRGRLPPPGCSPMPGFLVIELRCAPTLTFVHSPVSPGGTAIVTVTTSPGSLCSVRGVNPSGANPFAGLAPIMADTSGFVSWSWPVGTASSGTWTVEVICSGQSARATFTVP